MDAIEDFAVVHAAELLLSGSVGADDPDAGVILFEDLLGAGGDAVATAEEEDAITFAGGEVCEPGDEIDTGNALSERAAEKLGSPDKGHAVWQDEAASGENAVKMGIGDGVEPKVEIRSSDLMGSARLDESFNGLNRFIGLDAIQGYSKNSYRVLEILLHLSFHSLHCK
jgi:hypothetical protein